MKILVICQYYYPEPFRITDICEELVKRGHVVTVVTGLPNYPMGEIYEGYRHGKKRDEVINGVKVHRCFTIGRKGGAVKRFLNYFSYPISASIYIGSLENDFDVVFVNQLSPVMMAWPAIRYKKKHNKKVVMYCLDLWPASLCAGGISNCNFIYSLFHHISARIYRRMDLILNTSRSFEEYQIGELKINKEIIKYLPQYAETIFSPERCRKESDGYIDLMFAGNIGYAQSVQTIIKAAALVKDERVRWHIVGDGVDLENCKKLAKTLGVKNITFYGRKKIEEMPEYYAMADAMLVTIAKDETLSLTLPGKVQSYMSAGKPIIAAVNGETQRTIEDAGCGLCCEAENEVALAGIVERFATENPGTLSRNAVEYYLNHFEKDCFIKKLIENMQGQEQLV